MTADEKQILELFDDGDRALVSADLPKLERIYRDDYIQYDEHGECITKQNLVSKVTSGVIRFISMRSIARKVRVLAEDFAIVHGSEEDEIEHHGRRFRATYLYMDVVIKRGGRWQIVASQLVKRA